MQGVTSTAEGLLQEQLQEQLQQQLQQQQVGAVRIPNESNSASAVCTRVRIVCGAPSSIAWRL